MTGISFLRWGEELVKWFETNQRDLPWRTNPTPYSVWISEVMLQQTQVDRVVSYYRRWMERFPDVVSVAGASLDELLLYWEGLGYYSRLINISKTAHRIVEEFGGSFPANYPMVRELPGIGPYTAGAVLSIACNQPYPAVDGNVKRVITRLFDYPHPVDSIPARRWIEDRVMESMPEGRAGAFNQALMELGACVCLPRVPRCPGCLFQAQCLASLRGTAARRPVRSRVSRRVEKTMVAGLVWDNARVYLSRRPDHGLRAGLWEFPSCDLTTAATDRLVLEEYLSNNHGLTVRIDDRLPDEIDHYTIHRVTLRIYRCTLIGSYPQRKDLPSAGWYSPKFLSTIALSATHRRIADRLL